jgi:hypothetical protein
MTQDERMQVYLEMSKESENDYLRWRDNEGDAEVSDEQFLREWNDRFEDVCKRLGVKP